MYFDFLNRGIAKMVSTIRPTSPIKVETIAIEEVARALFEI